ncbi:MAG: NAD-dependent epimerase/dehydratase family protein [Candidatus Limnocylindria bacterium]
MSSLRVLVTGHQGYLGPVLVDELLTAGHEVAGLDIGYFVADEVEPGPAIRATRRDIREVTAEELVGFDAIVHLAGLSNDPLGMLDPELTHAINVEATVALARLAREVGVRRFVNFSSCSVYGAAVDDWVDEETEPRPVTAYAASKVEGERLLQELCDHRFTAVSLRNATAFGYSSGFRVDLVVNDLTLSALRDGTIRLNSDGTAWRPICHVRDIAQAAALALVAPDERVRGEIVNIGSEDQNYRILEVAAAIEHRLPGVKTTFAMGAGPDQRSYRVRFSRVRRVLPDFRPRFDLASGVDDLIANVERVGVERASVASRLTRLTALRDAGQVDVTLRPVDVPSLSR